MVLQNDFPAEESAYMLINRRALSAEGFKVFIGHDANFAVLQRGCGACMKAVVYAVNAEHFAGHIESDDLLSAFVGDNGAFDGTELDDIQKAERIAGMEESAALTDFFVEGDDV